MKRRPAAAASAAGALLIRFMDAASENSESALAGGAHQHNSVTSEVATVEKSDAEWREQLSPEAYDVLRKEATERPGSSELNNVKAAGEFRCAGCDLPLFRSEYKFESGTGWPSFFDYIDEHLAFKTDYKMLLPRKEYHCARCGGHQGHVFTDGPEPTGKRYCNNGVALAFVPDDESAA